MPKISKVLISQAQPEGKSPYFDIAEKYGVEIVFRPFIKVEGLTVVEFLKQKIDLSKYNAIVFFAQHGIDNFFRLAKETKVNIVPELKYYCLNEKFAHYLQTYVKFRKRKIFYTENGKTSELFGLFGKYAKTDRFLFILPEAVNDEIDSLINSCKIEKYDRCVMYRTVPNLFSKKEKFDYDMSVFFSPHGIASLKKSFPKFEQDEHTYFGCLGKLTADSIREAGFRVDLEVPNPQFTGMVPALEDFIKKNHKGSKK